MILRLVSRTVAFTAFTACLRLAAQTATSQAVPTEPTSTTPPAAAAAEPTTGVSLWDITGSIRASVGWRKNVTQSAFQPVDRAFWRTEAEAFVLRPIGSDWEFISFLSGDVLRYSSPPAGVSGEQEWIGHLEGRWQPVSFLRTSLKVDGSTDSTFIDPSETEGALQQPMWVRVRGGYSTLIQRIELPLGFALEPAVQVKRITYRGYNGDYDEIRPGVRLEWKRSDRLVLSASWYEHTRHYSELTESRPSNRPIAGWLLTIHQREGEVRASTQFQGDGTWTVAASASRLENRDQAYGFLNYNQNRAHLDVNWAHGQWRTILGADARRLDYLVQQLSLGIQHFPRITDAYEFSGRVERELNERWMVFAEERWERNRSNIVDDAGGHPFSYRQNTAFVGLQRTF